MFSSLSLKGENVRIRGQGGKEQCGEIHVQGRTSINDDEQKVSVSSRQFDEIVSSLTTASSLNVSRRPPCPAHDMPFATNKKKKKNIVKTIMVILLRIILGLLYALLPPWPPIVLHKITFRPPVRGRYYYLHARKDAKSPIKTVFNCSEAIGAEEVTVVLPHLIEKKINAVDIYYHLLRCNPVMIGLEDGTPICILELKCEQTVTWYSQFHVQKNRSPQLLIFAQPNSSDLGSCMLTEPNFADIADFLQCDLLIFDYPGYGVSGGRPSETAVYRTIEAVFKYAVEEMGYTEADICIVGFSLGTAAAIHLASMVPQLGAAVLIAPFTSLLRVFFRRPRMKTTLFFDMFPSVDKASAIKCPTLVCHGVQDRIVPPEHGWVIHEKIDRSELYLVERTSHQGIFSERVMWDQVLVFLEENMQVTKRWREALFVDSLEENFGPLPTPVITE